MGEDSSDFEQEAWVHTLSNSCVMSRNATEQYCLFSKVPRMISVILWTWLMVVCCCRNPNWWSRRIRFSTSIGRSILSIVISKILLIIGSKPIDLYKLNSSSCLRGFGIITIYVTFHWAAKYPVQIMELHMDVTWTVPFLGISFNILPVIRSYPGACLGLRSFLYHIFHFRFRIV
jgi:hypothetical protein